MGYYLSWEIWETGEEEFYIFFRKQLVEMTQF